MRLISLVDFAKYKKKEEIEVKEAVITPAIETPTPIRHEPIIYKDTLTEEEIREYIDKRIKAISIRHKPIVHKEALTKKEMKAYIDKQISEQTRKEQKIVIKDYNYVLDEFYQLKGYFRSWNKDPKKCFSDRPNMDKAIKNFEKHLKEAIKR